MRTPIAILALVLTGSLGAHARPGPHTANRLNLAPEWVSEVRVESRPSCPETWVLHLTAAMPTPGWTVTTDRVDRLDDARLVVYLTGAGPDGVVIQVITPTAIAVSVPSLRKGRTVVELRYRAGADAPYERRAVFLVLAS